MKRNEVCFGSVPSFRFSALGKVISHSALPSLAKTEKCDGFPNFPFARISSKVKTTLVMSFFSGGNSTSTEATAIFPQMPFSRSHLGLESLATGFNSGSGLDSECCGSGSGSAGSGSTFLRGAPPPPTFLKNDLWPRG